MYWNDEETGELCRIRPDKWLNEHNVIVDVKKVADMDRFARHIEEFRYHVQDAMYREGAMRVTGQPHGFSFLPSAKALIVVGIRYACSSWMRQMSMPGTLCSAGI